MKNEVDEKVEQELANLKKGRRDHRWIIGICCTAVFLLISFGWSRMQSWGTGKTENAVWKNNIEEGQRLLKCDICRVDSLYSEKNRAVNLRVDQTIDVLRVVVENQEIMINQQNNMTIVVSKMCKKIDGMADDAEFLKLKGAGSMINARPKIDHYEKPLIKDNNDMLLPEAFDSTFGQGQIVKIPCNSN